MCGGAHCARSREAVLAEIGKLPRGTWHNSMTLDGDDAPVTLQAALTISDEGIHVDYTGTSGQSRYGINVPLSYTIAYTVFGLGCVVASQIPNNAGSLGPLTDRRRSARSSTRRSPRRSASAM